MTAGSCDLCGEAMLMSVLETCRTCGASVCEVCLGEYRYGIAFCVRCKPQKEKSVKKLYRADYQITVYFWSDVGDEVEEADLALENEVESNITMVSPDTIRSVESDSVICSGWENAIPWGEAPEGMHDLSVSKLQHLLDVKN